MEASSLHPELREGITRIPRLPFEKRWMLPVARAIFNLAGRTSPIKGVSMTEESTAKVELEVFRPSSAGCGAALLWIHGGGHVAGAPNSLRSIASRFAEELGAVVAVPKYRLAPRHPFPADLDDCHEAWRWLVMAAEGLGIDPARIAIVGNSAGGGLAAALAQRLRDEGGLQPIAQVLFYPMLDDRTAASSDLDGLGHFIWTNRANRVAWSAYLAPHTPGAPSLPPYAAPARSASLAGLPRTWLGIGDVDLFAAEAKDYAARLERDGVSCELVEVEGAPHAFEVLVPDATVSKDFVNSALSFLLTHVSR